jgi:hypothetical protein
MSQHDWPRGPSFARRLDRFADESSRAATMTMTLHKKPKQR